jgi:hypothetical protein
MARDFDDIYKKIDQSHKDLCKQDSEISNDINNLNKDQQKILKDLTDIKKQVKDIGTKVDIMLEILNNFTIMLAEDDEDLEENYDFDNDSDESWASKEDDFWEDDNDESV